MKGKQLAIALLTIAATLAITAGVANSAPRARITAQHVATESAVDTNVVKVQSTDCPAGTVATGGGYDFLGSTDVAAGVLISSTVPTGSAGNEGWTIAAINRSGIADAAWGIRVWAVCAS